MNTVKQKVDSRKAPGDWRWLVVALQTKPSEVAGTLFSWIQQVECWVKAALRCEDPEWMNLSTRTRLPAGKMNSTRAMQKKDTIWQQRDKNDKGKSGQTMKV